MEKRTKQNAILRHLKEYGRISSMEAFELYGATRLSAIIFNLRHKYEMNISNERKCITDRYGNTCYYDDYVLEAKKC